MSIPLQRENSLNPFLLTLFNLIYNIQEILGNITSDKVQYEQCKFLRYLVLVNYVDN